jgi:hypothetical protein
VGDPCFTYEVTDEGELLLTDSTGATVWSSVSSPMSSDGTMLQLQGQAKPSNTSCIISGPPEDTTFLRAPDQSLQLALSPDTGLLLTQTSDSAPLWQSEGAAAGVPPMRACLGAGGVLTLATTTNGSFSAAGSQLWNSTMDGTMVLGASGPYTALLDSSTGALHVLDGSCATVWCSTTNRTGQQAVVVRRQPVQLSGLRRPSALLPLSPSPSPPPSPSSLPPPSPEPSPPPPPSPKALLFKKKLSSPAPKAIKPPKASQPPAGAKKSPRPRSTPQQLCPAGVPRTLNPGQACGGTLMCGEDTACSAVACCKLGTRCAKVTERRWTCQRS